MTNETVAIQELWHDGERVVKFNGYEVLWLSPDWMIDANGLHRKGLPSSADLDSVAEEREIKEKTTEIG